MVFGPHVALEIAEAVFGQRVAADDSLYDLGVDSLQIAEYCDRLEQALGRQIDVSDLMDAESFGSFSHMLAAAAEPDR